jgi:hypothetical protein
MATRTQASEAKRKLLHQAEDAYRRFTRIGAGPRVHHASDRLAEIADEINNLDPP